jgi:hypothetical protein
LREEQISHNKMEEAPIRFHSLDREYEKTFRALISPAYQGKTEEHPHPWIGWNFSQRFPDLPVAYRRSVIKDAIGKARSYLSHRVNWEKSGKRKVSRACREQANTPPSTKAPGNWISPT